jgi:hypothetical protein
MTFVLAMMNPLVTETDAASLYRLMFRGVYHLTALVSPHNVRVSAYVMEAGQQGDEISRLGGGRASRGRQVYC